VNGQAYGQSYYCHPFTSPPFLPRMVAEAGKAYKRKPGRFRKFASSQQSAVSTVSTVSTQHSVLSTQHSMAVAEIAEDFPSDFGIVARVRRIGEVDFALVTFACEEDSIAVDGHRERL